MGFWRSGAVRRGPHGDGIGKVPLTMVDLLQSDGVGIARSIAQRPLTGEQSVCRHVDRVKSPTQANHQSVLSVRSSKSEVENSEIDSVETIAMKVSFLHPDYR